MKEAAYKAPDMNVRVRKKRFNKLDLTSVGIRLNFVDKIEERVVSEFNYDETVVTVFNGSAPTTKLPSLCKTKHGLLGGGAMGGGIVTLPSRGLSTITTKEVPTTPSSNRARKNGLQRRNFGFNLDGTKGAIPESVTNSVQCFIEPVPARFRVITSLLNMNTTNVNSKTNSSAVSSTSEISSPTKYVPTSSDIEEETRLMMGIPKPITSTVVPTTKLAETLLVDQPKADVDVRSQFLKGAPVDKPYKAPRKQKVKYGVKDPSFNTTCSPTPVVEPVASVTPVATPVAKPVVPETPVVVTPQVSTPVESTIAPAPTAVVVGVSAPVEVVAPAAVEVHNFAALGSYASMSDTEFSKSYKTPVHKSYTKFRSGNVSDSEITKRKHKSNPKTASVKPKLSELNFVYVNGDTSYSKPVIVEPNVKLGNYQKLPYQVRDLCVAAFPAADSKKWYIASRDTIRKRELYADEFYKNHPRAIPKTREQIALRHALYGYEPSFRVYEEKVLRANTKTKKMDVIDVVKDYVYVPSFAWASPDGSQPTVEARSAFAARLRKERLQTKEKKAAAEKQAIELTAEQQEARRLKNRARREKKRAARVESDFSSDSDCATTVNDVTTLTEVKQTLTVVAEEPEPSCSSTAPVVEKPDLNKFLSDFRALASDPQIKAMLLQALTETNHD